MWAEVYERSFVNVRRRLKRNYAALGCCAEVYEMWAKVYERSFVNVADLRTSVRKCGPRFTNDRS